MAANKNIFIKIDVSSKKAKKDVNDVEKGVNKLAIAEKKLAYELSEEAKQLAKVNAATRDQKLANEQAASSVTKFGSAVGGARTQVGLNNAILTEAGRAASDLRFGFNGVANNVGQLASLFGNLIQTSDNVVTSLKNLGKSLMGTGGILIAVQLLIAYGDQIYDFFFNSGKAVDEFNEKIKEASKSIREQSEELNLLADSYFKYQIGNKALEQTVERLVDRFSEFRAGYENLNEEEKKNEVLVQGLIKEYDLLLKKRIELKEKEKEIQLVKERDGVGDEKRLIKLRAEYNNLSNTIIDLQKRFNRDPLFEGALGIKFDKGEWEENKELVLEETIEFIDDVDEVAGIYALNKGKESLLSKMFKLSPKTREAELKKLKEDTEKFGEEALFETIAYRDAVQAVNDKYDLAERKAKVKHLQTMLGGLSDFLKSAADIANGNKDIARASIIASAAASSVGVWEAWLVKDPTFTPAPLKVAGAIATQLAIVASTVSALKSLNTNTPISSGSAGGGATIQAPNFNVVGASSTDQLAQAVGGQVNEPIRAFVVGSDVTNQQELDRRIVDTAGIG